jgi:hypothetical protein
MKQFQKKVINWLLEESNPPVRYLTLKNLLRDSKAAQKSKSLLMTYEVTRDILKNRDNFSLLSDDKSYWKYKGKYWQIIFLGQFLADGQHPVIAELAQNIIEIRKKWISKFKGQCLAANILAALMRLGYANHPIVIEETKKLARQIVANSGIKCDLMDYSLQSLCYMATPKFLLCFNELPKEKRSAEILDAIKIIVQTLLDNQVYIYVPENRRKWQKILEDQPKHTEIPKGQTVKAWILEQKKKFLNHYDQGGRIPKQGWLKFGFPLSYNSDILEAMYSLALHEVPMHSSLEKPLQIIIDKMTREGQWILENSLNGKMWADVEEKGKASKWLTYFALKVLDHFEKSL